MKPDYPIRFGKYFLLNRLAVGGMAEVFRAKLIGPKGFEKKLAIKKILPEFSYDEEFVQMFVDEARISSHLHHPNIVPVFDFGQVDQQYYIAMELVEGTNLKNLFFRSLKQERVLSRPLVYFMVSKIASALDYAHHVNIEGEENKLQLVHRDVSPQNILISRRGEIKITDFGIAKAAIKLTQTQPGKIQGKYSYMSPEQALGRGIDHRSDIFSLGIIFFELLTGKKVYGSTDSVERYKQATKAKIPRLNKVLPDIPSQVDQLVTAMLSKDPSQRPAHCSEIVKTLTGFISNYQDDQLMKELGTVTTDLFPVTAQEKQAQENIPEIIAEPAEGSGPFTFKDQSFHPNDPSERKERTERPFVFSAWLSRHPGRVLAILCMVMLAGWAAWGLMSAPKNIISTPNESTDTPDFSQNQTLEDTTDSAIEPNASTLSKSKTELEAELIDIERQIQFVENEIKMITAPAAPKARPKPSESKKAAALSCPSDMVRIKAGLFYQGSDPSDQSRQELLERPMRQKKFDTFCIDRFEYPNLKGRTPLTGQSYEQAQTLCKAKNKKLCLEDQWERACKGPNSLRTNTQYPYGATFAKKLCNVFERNIEGTKNYKLPVAGGFSKCVSPEGIFDLSGGVAEWTASQGLLNPQAFVVKGGSFKTDQYASRCSSMREQTPQTVSADIGFRCCK